MQMESILLRGLPPSVADAPAAGDEWAKSPVSGLSDMALAAARVIKNAGRDKEIALVGFYLI